MSSGISMTVTLDLFLFVFLLIGHILEHCIILKILPLFFAHTPFVSCANIP